MCWKTSKVINLTLPLYHGVPGMSVDPKCTIIGHHTIDSMKYNITQLSLGITRKNRKSFISPVSPISKQDCGCHNCLNGLKLQRSDRMGARKHGWIKEGKYVLKWTRLSCHDFVDNQVRLQLFALAYNLGNFLRRLVLPKSAKTWSLRRLREKLIKIGAKVVNHSRYVIF